MIFGYARVSTDDQNLSLQIDALTHYGIDVCGKINVHTIAAQKYITPQAA